MKRLKEIALGLLIAISPKSYAQTFNDISSLPSVTVDYLFQNGAVLSKTSRILNTYYTVDSLKAKYSQIIVAKKPLTIGNVRAKVNSEFLFYSGKLYSAELLFDAIQRRVIESALTNKYGKGISDDTLNYWGASPSIPLVFVFYYRNKRDTTTAVLDFCNVTNREKLNSFITDRLWEIPKENSHASAQIKDTSWTKFSDWESLYHTEVFGTEIKTGELYIGTTPKIVPKGVIWKIVQIQKNGIGSNQAGIFLENDNIIPINYHDYDYDIAENTTSPCLVFNTIDEISDRGANVNIDAGSYPISTMPFAYVSGYKLKAAAPNIRLLVYVYKYSQKQLIYLGRH